MARLELSAEARQDIDDIYDYIARHDRRQSTADSVVSELTKACQSLASSIANGFLIGTARPDLLSDARVLSHQRWVVVFRPIDDGIEVIRVLDGSRDFSKLLRQ
jgi:toxin ParE1/3/4